MSVGQGNAGGLKTELTLALPGARKRSFEETVDLNLQEEDQSSVVTLTQTQYSSLQESEECEVVVGWPPVRSLRKKMMKGCSNNCKFVKVAVDGAPYLRKIDLEICSSYKELMAAFQDMFIRDAIAEPEPERKMMESRKYVPTYEDKDGDWMLVGDVPWKMFVESCKRLRLLKSSEAIGLAPKTMSPNGSQASSSTR